MRRIGLLMVAGVIGFSNDAEAQEWEVYEGYAVVKGNGTKEKLVFSDTDAQDLDEFVDLCREVCTSGEGDGPKGACGGFVVNYTTRERKVPKSCVFKLAGSETYAKGWKDTHMLVDPEAASVLEAEGWRERGRIEGVIRDAVTEALEGMVPEEEVEAAVAEATAQVELWKGRYERWYRPRAGNRDATGKMKLNRPIIEFVDLLHSFRPCGRTGWPETHAAKVCQSEVEAAVAEWTCQVEADLLELSGPGAVCDSSVDGALSVFDGFSLPVEGKYTHGRVEAEAAPDRKDRGGERGRVQALIDNTVTEALEGMVPEEEVAAAVAEATAQIELWKGRYDETNSARAGLLRRAKGQRQGGRPAIEIVDILRSFRPCGQLAGPRESHAAKVCQSEVEAAVAEWTCQVEADLFGSWSPAWTDCDVPDTQWPQSAFDGFSFPVEGK